MPPLSRGAASRAAGKRFEKKVATFLGTLGFLVETAKPKLCHIGPGRVISISHDFYGVIDHIAIHPRMAQTLLIQSTLAANQVVEKMRAIDAVPFFGPAHDLQVWTRDSSTRNRFVVWRRQAMLGVWNELTFRMEPGQWPSHVLGAPPRQPAL